MSRSHSNRRPSPFSDALRSCAARWLAVLLLTPLLVLSSFGGTRCLTHAHDGRDSVAATAQAQSATHRGLDACQFHCESDRPADVPVNEPAEPQDSPCILVALPDQDQLPSRAVEIERPVSTEDAFAAALSLVLALPEFDPLCVAPDGRPTSSRGPAHLLALRVGDRLVRTSCALLI